MFWANARCAIRFRPVVESKLSTSQVLVQDRYYMIAE